MFEWKTAIRSAEHHCHFKEESAIQDLYEKPNRLKAVLMKYIIMCPGDYCNATRAVQAI